MRNKSKKIVAIAMAMLVASSTAAMTATTAFASETPVTTAETQQTFTVAVDTKSDGMVNGKYTYDGTEKMPDLKFYVGKQLVELVEHTDYTVDIEGSNVNAGTFNVVVKGIGDYTGTHKLAVQILPKKFEVDGLVSFKNVVYNGKAQTPKIQLSAAAIAAGLTEDDFIVTYVGDNVNATDHTNKQVEVSVAPKKGENYSGADKAYFNIVRAQITGDNVDEIEDQVFKNAQIRPDVVVRADLDKDPKGIKETVLTEGIDYKVTYGDNITGTGTVKITPMGNYRGAVIEEDFAILENIANRISKVEFVTPNPVYDMKDFATTEGKGFLPPVKVTDKNGVSATIKVDEDLDNATVRADGSVKVQTGDWYAIYKNNMKAGKATVTVGCKNFAGQSEALSFNIEATKITEADVEATKTFIYNPLVPATFTAEDLFNAPYETLVEGVDYTTRYTNNDKAGEAKVTITFIGAYADSNPITKTFTINKASLANATVKPASGKTVNKEFTGKEAEIASSDVIVTKTFKDANGNNIDVTVPTSEYKVTTTARNVTDVDVKDTLTIAAADESNYNTATVDADILKITPADWKDVTLKALSILRDDTDVTDTATNIAAVENAVTATLGNYALVLDKDYVVESATWNKGHTALIAKIGVPDTGSNFGVPATAKTITISVGEQLTSEVIEIFPDESKNHYKYFADDVMNLVYDGTAKMPKLNIRALPDSEGNTPSLTEGVDYEYVYMKQDPTNTANWDVVEKPVDAGTYCVTVWGKGDYAGRVWINGITYGEEAESIFEIKQKSLADASITAETSVVVTKPSDLKDKDIVVKDGDRVLKLGVDYVVKVTNQTDAAGNLIVKILPGSNENYTGAASVKVTVKKDLTKCTLTTPTTLPIATLTDGAATLTSAQIEQYKIEMLDTETNTKTRLVYGKDYTVAYENNTTTGTGTIVFVGAGDYTGKLTAEFKIVKGEVSIADAEISAIPNQVWTGDEITPKVTVTLNGKELVEGVDYKAFAWSNTNTGKATLKIKGMGMYEGSDSVYVGEKKVSFVIVPQQVTGLKAIKKTQTTLKLKFNKCEGADGYKIYDAETGKALVGVSTQGGADVLTKTVTGLKAGETRKYRVRAYTIVNGVKRYGQYSETYSKATAEK